METLQNLLRGITRNQQATDSSNSSAQNNVDADADVNMDVDQQDDHNSLPDLQSVSNSSDSVTSDEEDQQDSREVVVQTAQFEESTPMIDPHTFTPEPTERRPSPPPRTSSRRARVEDDEDEERDRRHPSQRVSRPATADSSAASLSSLTAAPTTPGISSQLRLPQPHPQLRRLPSFSSRLFDSPLSGAGIALNPLTANNNNNNTANPSISHPNTNARNAPAPPQSASRDTRPRPRMPPVFNSFAITVDFNGTPVVRHFGVEPSAQGPPNQPQPDPQDQQAGRQPQVTPGAQAPTPTLFDLVGMRDLFSLLQGPGGAGLLESLTREPEDPDRARRLVDALEEVPVGLVRRLERVGDGDEVGCAICWDKLLDAEGFSETGKKDENVHAREPESQASHSEEDSGSSSNLTPPERKYPKIVSLPCAHVFHASCLIPWFSRPKQTTCPTCRFNIDPENLTWKRRRFPSNASTGNATGNVDHATPVVAQNVAEGDVDHRNDSPGPSPALEDAQGPAAFIPQFTPLFTLSRTVPLFPQGNGNNQAQGQEHAGFPPTGDGAPAATQNSQSTNTVNPEPHQPNTNLTANTNPTLDLPGFVTVGFDVIVGGFPPMPMGGHVPGLTRPPDGTSDTGPGAPDVEMADAERPGAEGEEGRPRELDFFDHMFNDMVRRLGGFVDLTRMRQQRDAGNQDAGAPAPREPQPQSISQTDRTTQRESQIPRMEPSDRPALPGSPSGTQPSQDHVDMQNVVQMGTEIGRTIEEALRRFMVPPGGATRTDGAGPAEHQEQASSSSSTGTPISESISGDVPMDIEEGSSATGRRNAQPAGTNVPDNQNEPHEDNEFRNLLANVLGARNATAVLEGMAQGAAEPNQRTPGQSQPRQGAEAQDHQETSASGDPSREPTHAGSGPASEPPRWNSASGPSEGRQTPIPPWAAMSFAGLDPNAAGAEQGQRQPQQQGAGAGTATQVFPPGFLPLPTMFFPGAFHVPSHPPREKKEWELPPAPGLTLRERVEKKEREAGLRCDDMSCGVGPSDEEPFADGSAGGQMVKIRALPKPGSEGRVQLGEEGEDAICPHVFHSSCLVSSERVALMGEDATVVGDDVEVNCSVCRSVGRIPKKIWDEGAKALA